MAKISLLMLCCLLSISNLNASQVKIQQFTKEDNYKRDVIYHCLLTRPEMHFLKKPQKFNKGNNLTRRSKDIFSARGQEIILEGYILDQDCVPITNASLQAWQTNNLGINQEGIQAKNLRNEPERLERFDTHFANNGSNSSDNTGFYRFILLKPCKACNKVVDFAVSHGKFQHLDTVVKFNLINDKENLDSLMNNNKLRCDNDQKCREEVLPSDKRLERYRVVLNRNKNLTLKQELAILCDEDVNDFKKRSNRKDNLNERRILIKSGDAIAKFIGMRDGKDVYRLDVVLSGANMYRKY